MKKSPVTKNVIPFAREYVHISPQDLEEILETSSDMDYLNEKGLKFRTAFWKLFIKKGITKAV